MIGPSYTSTTGNVPHLDPGRVNCQSRAAAPRARDAWFSPENLRNPAHDRCAGLMRQFCHEFCPGQVYSRSIAGWTPAYCTKFSTSTPRTRQIASLGTAVPMNAISGMSYANSKINLPITSNAVDSFALPDPETRDSTYNFKKTRTEINYNCIYLHLKKLQLGPIDAASQKLQYALKNTEQCTCYYFSFFLLFLMK